jgi:phosphate transport system substrate-binding protein
MRNRKVRVLVWLGVILLAGWRAGWPDLLINGAGATFPYPIYSKWLDLYAKANPGFISTINRSVPVAASVC